tara:strand:- start:77 stop:484 length:408 start_codon:yes stop_codon:yes gene_type:complete
LKTNIQDKPLTVQAVADKNCSSLCRAKKKSVGGNFNALFVLKRTIYPTMRKIWLIILSVSLALVLFFIARSEAIAQTRPNSKFYDFGEQIIDGEIKKPTALYTDSKRKVKFDRLLKLKKTFIPDLMETSKERTFK